MTSKQKKIIFLSAVVSLSGFAVMAVYVSGFVSRPDAAAALERNLMSFSSALCFFLSGAAFYFIARAMEKEIAVAQVVLPVISLAISVFIIIHVVSMAMGGFHGRMAEPLGIESYDLLDQMVLIHPSLEEMVNFILFSVAGILAMMYTAHFGEKIYFIGKVIIFVSAVALLERFLNLNHFIGSANKPMGMASFFMFILLGAGLMTVCRSK
jgi:hypothetical protein